MSARLASNWLVRSSSIAMGAALLTVGLSTPARAQSFNGNGSVLAGSAEIVNDSPGVTDVQIFSDQVVIDWIPFDGATGGGPIDFQSAGTTATFANGSSILTNFAVLNRILPVDAARPVQFNGTVNGRITDFFSGTTSTGGTIFFYSPGGIVLGPTASFDAGALGLTTAPPAFDPQTGEFVVGGSVNYGTANPGTAVVINNGAQITAPVDQSSYVAVFAPVIQQNGLINVNGSTALVAGEAGTLTWNNGLFDIEVTLGTDGNGAGNAILHGGTTGGTTASGGSGDLHRVYMVAVPKNNAITQVIASGSQLGFDVAGAADTFGNAVVLTAGFDEVGFGQVPSAGAGTGTTDISVSNTAVTSSLLVNSKGTAFIQAVGGGTTALASDLTVIGGDSARVESTNNGSVLTVGGNLSMAATRTGDPATGAVTGGVAVLTANMGGSLSVAGSANLDASADFFSGTFAADATGGTARVLAASGGSIDIGSDLFLFANGSGSNDGPMGNGTGGLAELLAMDGSSTVDIGGGLSIKAQGFGGGLDGGFAGFAGGQGFGGTARIDARNGTGNNISVADVVDVNAGGFGGEGNQAISGNGTGGQSLILAGAGSTLSFGGDVNLYAHGASGFNFSGVGGAGNGFGGTAMLRTDAANATISVIGDLIVDTTGSSPNVFSGAGFGGNGTGGTSTLGTQLGSVGVGGAVSVLADGTGGDGGGTDAGGSGTGGLAQITVDGGTMTLASLVAVEANGDGGSSSSGDGGAGIGGVAAMKAGNGGSLSLTGSGSAVVVASASGLGGESFGAGNGGNGGSGAIDMSAAQGASITISGDTSLFALASGGDGANGGDGDGRKGGSLPPAVQMIASDGNLTVNGALSINLDGVGGNAMQTGGTGGDGFAGAAFVQKTAGASAGGSLQLADLFISALGFGGNGGGGNLSSTLGAGGAGGVGEGGTVVVTGSATSGTLSTGLVSVQASGFGGSGGDGDSDDGGAAAGLVGGNGGVGGAAMGGIVRLGIIDSGGPSANGSAGFGDVSVSAGATGGGGGAGGSGPGGLGNGGAGGAAIATQSRTNASQIIVQGGVVTAGGLSFDATAVGGFGGTGATDGIGGDATAGEVDLIVSGGSVSGARGTLTAASITTQASAFEGIGSIDGTAFFGGGPVVSVVDGDVTVSGGVDVFMTGTIPSGAIPTPEARLFLSNATFGVSGDMALDTSGNLSVFAQNSTLSAGQLFLEAADFVPDAGGTPAMPGTLSANSIFVNSANNVLIDANLDDAGGLFLSAAGAISIHDLVSSGDIFVTSAGPITLGDLNGLSVEITTGSDISIGNAVSATDIDLDSGGAITTGAIDAAADVSMQAGNTIVVNGAVTGLNIGLLAQNSLTALDLTADNQIGLGAGTGSVSAGLISAGADVLVLARTGVTLGGIQSNGNASQFVYIADSAMIALSGTLDPFDPAPIFASAPTAMLGPVTVNGPVTGGNLVFASLDAVTLGDVTAQGAIRGQATAMTVGDMSTPDVIDLNASGTMSLGALSSGTNILLNGLADITAGALTSGGDIDIIAGGAIAAGDATGGAILLRGTNGIAVDGISGSFVDLDSGQGLAINGIVTAPVIEVSSMDIAIAAAGRLDAGTTGTINISGMNGDGMVLGDGVAGSGVYRLDNAEFSRIRSGFLNVYRPDLPNLAVDLVIGDLAVFGPLSGGTINGPGGGLAIFTGLPGSGTISGRIRVTGTVRATGFNAGNYLHFNTGVFELDATSGLLEMLGSGSNLSGEAIFSAQRIHVAQASILDALAADPLYAGRVDDLNSPLATPRPDGVVRAGGIETTNAIGILVQNTGTAFLPAGFLTNADGPIDPGTAGPGSVDFIVNGQLLTPSGTLTGGAVLDVLVDDSNRAIFTPQSTVNGCAVSGSGCVVVAAPDDVVAPSLQASSLNVAPPPSALADPPAPSSNEEVSEPATEEEREAREEAQEDAEKAPVPPPAPLINSQPLNPGVEVDEPVSGSGNPALIGPGVGISEENEQ